MNAAFIVWVIAIAAVAIFGSEHSLLPALAILGTCRGMLAFGRRR
jgi:hypothetical protein